MALVQTPPAPSLQEATKLSTVVWQENLEELFKEAKDRFPDVVWELVSDGPSAQGDDSEERVVMGEVWGHKAIVYARAPPSFQSRYFAFRPGDSAVSLPRHGDEEDDQEDEDDEQGEGGREAMTPSLTSLVPSTSTSTNLLRLTTSISPALFSNELEYLYTGKGFGEAFEFLFDSNFSTNQTSNSNEAARLEDAEDMRIDKLRKDLVFMWRSRLYSDVRLALTGNFSSSSGGNHESTTAIFSSHRFILVSRSPYFHTALIGWPTNPNSKTSSGEPPTLTLPSPPFTPASVHFTLGFMYTGTLIFSHRTYDLTTAFAILRSALYLGLPTLHDEIQARIAQEMLHGLFHAFIPFNEYECLTGGKWGTGGCRCRQCARRAPRVIEFALAEDVKNTHLERGARRALVGLFGEGWCTPEFASLSPKIRESVLRGVAKRTTPLNVFPLLWAAEHAFGKLGNVIEAWGDVVRDMIGVVRKGCEDVICGESEDCFGEGNEEWDEVMRGDGVGFEDGERVDWVMSAVLRGVKEGNAAVVYQTLVSSILLRPHPTDINASLLSPTSHIRVQVEQTRMELVKWIGKRWLAIRQERGFDQLEGWALKEISDQIEVPVEDLRNPPPSYTSKSTLNSTTKRPSNSSPNHNPSSKHHHHLTHTLRPTSNHPHTSKVDVDSEMSMRASVLSRSFRPSNGSSSVLSSMGRERERSEKSSVHSLARSVASSSSGVSVSTTSTATGVSSRRGVPATTATTTGLSPARRIVNETRAAAAAVAAAAAGTIGKDRPDSKFDDGSQFDVDVDEYDDAREGVDLEGAEAETGEEDSLYGAEDGDGDGESMYEEQDQDHTADGEGGEEAETSTLASVLTTPRRVVTTPTGKTTRNIKSSPTPTRTNTKTPTSTVTPPKTKTLITRASLINAASKVSPPGGVSTARRPKSPGASSIASKASTIRRSGTTYASVRTSPGSRPVSRTSTTRTTPKLSVTTASPKSPISPTGSTPNRSVSRTSRASTASTLSTLSTSTANRPFSTATSGTGTTTSEYRTASNANSAGGLTPVQVRSRRTSAASTTSVASSVASSVSRSVSGGAGGGVGGGGRPRTRTISRSTNGSPVDERKRKVSGASVVSTKSVRGRVTSGGTAKTATPATKGAAATKAAKPVVPPVPDSTRKRVVGATVAARTVSAASSKSSGSGKEQKAIKDVVDDQDPEKEEEKRKSVVDVVEDVPIVEYKEEPVVVEKILSKVEEDKENKVPVPLPVSITTPAPATSKVEDDVLEEKLDVEKPLENTSSTLTIKPRPRPPHQPPHQLPHTQPLPHITSITNTEHKKTSSSASTASNSSTTSSSSVATLKKKGSNDTIRTVKSTLSMALGSSTGSGRSEVSKLSSSNLREAISIPSMSSSIDAPAQPSLPASTPPTAAPPAQNPKPLPPQPSIATVLSASTVPRGDTLDIGIPCIISSKRKRFKAYARYIGEVEGETGSWVGVEVPLPVGDNMWGDRDANVTLGMGSGMGSQILGGNGGGVNGGGVNGGGDDRPWHDGSWGGIRYFEINGGGGGSEWDYGAGAGMNSGGDIDGLRASRRRRLDASSTSAFNNNGGGGSFGYGYGRSGLNLKREGDAISVSSERMKRMRSVSPAVSDVSGGGGGTEARGLFVRPQQVLYVVDAVGADL